MQTNILLKALDQHAGVYFVAGENSDEHIAEAYRVLNERDPNVFTGFFGSKSYIDKFRQFRTTSAQALEVVANSIAQQQDSEEQIANIFDTVVRQGSFDFFLAHNVIPTAASDTIFKKIAPVAGVTIIHLDAYDHNDFFFAVQSLLEHYGYQIACDVKLILNGQDVTELAKNGGVIA